MTAAVCLVLMAPAAQDGAWPKDVALARLAPESPVVLEWVPGYVRSLADQHAEVRIAAMQFWARRGDELRIDWYSALEEKGLMSREGWHDPVSETVKAVVEAIDVNVDDRDPRVSRTALRSLCSLGTPVEAICPPQFICGNGMDSTFQGQVFSKLIERTKSHKGELLALADDKDPTVVYNAFRFFEPDVRRTVRTSVLGLIKRSDKYFRAVGLDIFVPLSDDDLVTVVGPLLDDPDPDVRECASRKVQICLQDVDAAFARRSDLSASMRKEIVEKLSGSSTGAVQKLLAMVSDPDGDVRAAAIDTLVSPESVPPLLDEVALRRSLYDPWGPVRGVALRGLLKRGAADRKALALAGFQDGHVKVRSASFYHASANFDLDFTDGVARSISEGIGDSWMVLDYFGHESNERLVDGWLRSKSPELRAAVLFALQSAITPYKGEPTQRDLDRSYPRFVRMAEDTHWDVLRWVIAGLSEFKTEEAVTTMVAAAGRMPEPELWYVFPYMERIQDPRVREFIARFVDSKDRSVRARARSAIQKLGGA